MPRSVRAVCVLALALSLACLTACGGGGGDDVSPSLPPTEPTVPVQPPTGSSLTLPSAHGLAAGELTVQPGTSAEHGDVVVSCPAGGSACVVNVAADGTATYDRTGGTPSVMAAYGPWELPSGHGLVAGRFTVAPGTSAEHGDVVVSCPAGGSACVVNVAADGTATYDRTGGTPSVMAQRLPVPFLTCMNASCPHYDIDDLPMQTAADALQMPVYQTQPSSSTPQKLFVGVERSGSASSVVGVRDGFDIRHGRVDDGAGTDRVAEYLRQTGQVDLAGYRQLTPDVVLPKSGDIVRYTVPPVVLYGGSPGARDIDRLVRAIQLVNTALPANWKLRMPTDAPVDARNVEISVIRPLTTGSCTYLPVWQSPRPLSNPSCHLWNAMSFSALIRVTQTPTRMEEEAHGRKNYSHLLPV